MERIFVSGISGLMGGTFSPIAAQRYKTYGSYSNHPVRIPNVEGVSLDLTNAAEVDRILDKICPDIIVHFAAATDVDWCETHRQETYLINVQSVRLLVDWAKNHGATFVYLSTDSVFDGEKGCYLESDGTKPLNYYAETKFLAEQMIRTEIDQHLIIRANIYGCNIQDKFSISEWALHKIRSGLPFKGFSDVIFTPLLVNSLSELIVHFMDLEVTGTLHLGSRDPMSKYDFINEIAKSFDLDNQYLEIDSVSNFNFIAPRPKNTSLSCKKALDLGLPIPTIRDDLSRLNELYHLGYPQTLKTWNSLI